MGTFQIIFNYNTQESELIMPEYGRNVQQLVNVCKNIEDEEERQGFAESIVELMHIITPYNRNYEEHRKKLWHHFFRIANYSINVLPPNGMEISRELDFVKPERVIYPTSTDRYRHYGAYVNQMIIKAKSMEDLEKKQAFAIIIASYMKTAFRNWNKEHYTSDESIKDDLANMSNGALLIGKDVVLEVIQGAPRHNRNSSFQRNNRNNKFNNKNNKFKRSSNRRDNNSR
ncbi:MAG: DUF4290 domain-containing protein [Saprospiraceae bacterium]